MAIDVPELAVVSRKWKTNDLCLMGFINAIFCMVTGHRRGVFLA